MAKAVADVNGDNTGGFASDGSNVTGFSQMHDSGTGGVSTLSHTWENVNAVSDYMTLNTSTVRIFGELCAFPLYWLSRR